MEALIKPVLEMDSFNRVAYNISKKCSPVLVSGVIDVQQAHLINALSQALKTPIIIITYSQSRARELLNDLEFFNKNMAIYLAKDIIFYNADVHSKDILKARFNVVYNLINNKPINIVMPIDSLFDKLMPQEKFKKYIYKIKVGDIVKKEKLIENLIISGYERCESIEGVGQFSSRGGIVDIFSPVEHNAVRIEFWDDEVDSIRSMDITSQRSIENIDEAIIFPMKEIIYDGNDIKNGKSRIISEFNSISKFYEEKGLENEKTALTEYVNEILEKLDEHKTFPAMESFVDFFCPEANSILDYMPQNTVLFFDEPKKISDHVKAFEEELRQSIESRLSRGQMLKGQQNFLFSYDDVIIKCSKFAEVLITSVIQSTPEFRPLEEVIVNVKNTPAFGQNLDLFCDELKQLKNKLYRILIFGGSSSRCERLVGELYDRGIESAFAPDINNINLEPGAIYITIGSPRKGFEYTDCKFAVFSGKELFREAKRNKRRRKKKKGMAIESFTDLKVGDYVVHDNHGIGIFSGMEKIVVDGVNKDYIKISYADGGSLFVPVNQMDMVQKYIGSDSAHPRLNKLGGQDWGKTKAKVKKSVQGLAEDLVKLYAKRQSAKGYMYSTDNTWQKEFEQSFPFDETDDQLDAIEDVKKDMESPKVMDRLICGDVGYGKTEVAIRAAFKAVQDGRQVAFLVPTTILAQQHYNTLKERMDGYPIVVDLLSRFRNAKEQKKTISNLEKGFVDIIVGTHRLLSKDVKFKDLGLIVVDEEQRFGVAHKEKLKALRENVDVLTLTATPIPRTLHMSLSGIRDMSILEEPPEERHTVQTYVLENNEEFIKDAINRELSRGGQVYYLHNRIETIEETAAMIQKLEPEASVAYAHGRMGETELEGIMKEFIDGDIDVLVCTTIIETGLDIPNVNTIIIEDADRMGLSQLYQLRGRVGRSNKIAYAYLLYRRDKALKEIAEKRLQTIKEFTEFGSGFKIAMRDLEIRGAGSLLGAEQHGHMEAVGYDMYCRLLNNAVQELKGEDIKENNSETSIDISVNAYIPDFYISNEEIKLEIYKKISFISNEDEYFDIQEEIEDRFGNMPKSVAMLLEIMLIKAEAHKLGVISISQKQKNIILAFKPDAQVNPEAITKLIEFGRGKIFFTSTSDPYITAMMGDKDTDVTGFIKNLLQKLK